MATDLKVVYQKRLLELAPNITGVEILKAETKKVAARATIYSYLRGEVKSLRIAEKIINHFGPLVKQRIERAKKIAA